MQFELVSFPAGKAYEAAEGTEAVASGASDPVTDADAREERALNGASLPHGEAGARIAAALRDEILGGGYQPGERIRQQELAGRHGASRVPVREALRILEAEGLVTIVANAGSWVSRLSAQECTEMYQIRERLEPLLLRYSADSLADGVISQLQDLADAMQQSADVEQFIGLDRRFHLLSYSAASTIMLGDTIMPPLESNPALPARLHPHVSRRARRQRAL